MPTRSCGRRSGRTRRGSRRTDTSPGSAGFRAFGVDLVQRDPAAGDFGFLVAFVAAPRQHVRVRPPTSDMRSVRRRLLVRRSVGTPASIISRSPAATARAARRSSRPTPMAPRTRGPMPRRRAPTTARGCSLVRVSRRVLSRHQVRDVEHARPTVTAMGKKKTPLRFDRARARLAAQPRVHRHARQRRMPGIAADNGVSAGYGAIMRCPSALATASPVPSLPVAGTDRPPVARMTRSAATIRLMWRW